MRLAIVGRVVHYRPGIEVPQGDPTVWAGGRTSGPYLFQTDCLAGQSHKLGLTMLSAQDVLNLQREQYQHDQRNHFEVFSLPKTERLKHYGLHFAKYVGRFARGAEEPKPVARTLGDATLICLSAANSLHQKLGNAIEYGMAPQIHADPFRAFADASGRFADACEKIDHLEEFVSLARQANVDIFLWILAFSSDQGFDTLGALEARRKELAERAFYVRG